MKHPTDSDNKLILTEDGSHTIISGRFDVSYHSKFGALQETQTVFIDAGLDYLVSRGYRNIDILEMGFGTGLNVIMTYIAIKGIQINYTTIEAYPLSKLEYQELNYPTIIPLDEKQTSVFLQMHSVPSDQELHLSDKFTFTKHIVKLEEFDSNKKYDLIYFDAFAPTSQEELWTEEIMKKLYNMCNPNAILVTYCAKGSFKRTLRAAGFKVEALEGPIGKREMTRGKFL